MKKVTAIDHKGQKIEFDVEEVFKETIAQYHKDIQQETAREILQHINTVLNADLGTYVRIELTMWISERYGLNEQQSKHHESTDTNTKRDTTD